MSELMLVLAYPMFMGAIMFMFIALVGMGFSVGEYFFPYGFVSKAEAVGDMKGLVCMEIVFILVAVGCVFVIRGGV